MGIKELLARRRSENRIQRHTRSFSHKQHNTEAELDELIQSVGNRVYRTGRGVANISQRVGINLDIDKRRKQEGKTILISSIKHGIGETTRAFLGPKPSQTNASVKKRRKR